MLISHHPASAECLQLGEGMLLCGFDLDKALSSRDPLDCMAEAVADDTKRIGTTCGGGIFRAVPREFDPESGSHRLPFAGSIRLIDWRVTLSGTMLDVTPENLARLLPSDTEMTEAAQLATNSLYTTLQQQSLLLALKEILGYLLVISIIIAVVSRFIPFHKTLRVTFKRTGDDMV